MVSLHSGININKLVHINTHAHKRTPKTNTNTHTYTRTYMQLERGININEVAQSELEDIERAGFVRLLRMAVSAVTDKDPQVCVVCMCSSCVHVHRYSMQLVSEAVSICCKIYVFLNNSFWLLCACR